MWLWGAVRHCPFWSEVAKAAFGGSLNSAGEIAEIARLQGQLNRQRHLPRLLTTHKDSDSDLARTLHEYGAALRRAVRRGGAGRRCEGRRRCKQVARPGAGPAACVGDRGQPAAPGARPPRRRVLVEQADPAPSCGGRRVRDGHQRSGGRSHPLVGVPVRDRPDRPVVRPQGATALRGLRQRSARPAHRRCWQSSACPTMPMVWPTSGGTRSSCPSRMAWPAIPPGSSTARWRCARTTSGRRCCPIGTGGSSPASLLRGSNASGTPLAVDRTPAPAAAALAETPQSWPTVCVITPTRGRPELRPRGRRVSHRAGLRR